jgi:hypothetical protein
MVTATDNLRLLNKGMETLTKGGDPDVQKIPTRMNMVGVKLREAKGDQEDSSWLTTRIEDPTAVAIVCL